MSASGENVMSTLCLDGQVYPTKNTAIGELVDLMNYKIYCSQRTDQDVHLKAVNVPTSTIVDMGKQLLQYARDGNKVGIKSLLLNGAPFTADWLGMSALHFAAMNNHLEICHILLSGGINKDAKTKVDRTPLHFAAYYGHKHIVQLLLSKKCAINVRDMLRMTPLHWAVEKKHSHIVRLLLKHNAEVDVVSKFGKTPIALAVSTEQAELLTELESAKKAQATQKFNKKHEKETSAAVNSIMDMDQAVEEFITQLEVDNSEMFSTADAFTSSFENIQVTENMYDNSAIDILKSHGISMLSDDGENSRALLDSALQNGRQLVLSEGGKLLLQNNNTNVKNRNVMTNSNASNVNNMGVGQVVPMQNAQCNNQLIPTNAQVQKLPQTVRIIPLEEVKQGISNSRVVPAALAHTQLARKIAAQQLNAINRSSATTTTSNNSQTKHNRAVVRPIQTPVVCMVADKSKHKDENLLSSGVIHIPKNTSKNALTVYPTLMQKQQVAILSSTSPATASATTILSSAASSNIGPIRIMKARRADNRTSTTPFPRLEPTSTLQSIPDINSMTPIVNGSQATQTNTVPSASPEANNSLTLSTTSNTPNTTIDANRQRLVVPLLSMPEICRQLFDLRKQNELLKRKFDIVNKEKEDLRHRLERIEEILSAQE